MKKFVWLLPVVLVLTYFSWSEKKDNSPSKSQNELVIADQGTLPKILAVPEQKNQLNPKLQSEVLDLSKMNETAIRPMAFSQFEEKFRDWNEKEMIQQLQKTKEKLKSKQEYSYSDFKPQELEAYTNLNREKVVLTKLLILKKYKRDTL